jgi:hypothetical protein
MSIMGKTATIAAKEIGCSTATVTRWADKLGVGFKHGSSYVLTERDIKLIAKHCNSGPGRPRKSA